jgi:hypothetical protein
LIDEIAVPGNFAWLALLRVQRQMIKEETYMAKTEAKENEKKSIWSRLFKNQGCCDSGCCCGAKTASKDQKPEAK